MQTQTSSGKTNPVESHPNPTDRNRSILWARYLVDTDDWVVVSTKVTESDSVEDDAIISISITDASGDVVYETLLKPEGIVSNEILAKHDLETSSLFNAQPYAVIRETLIKLLSSKDVYAWNYDKQRTLFEKLDKKYNMPPHEWRGNSVSHQYARYIGEHEDDKPGYQMQKLKVKGISARAQNKAVRETIVEMASSSQHSDPLVSGKPGWTAEFYKPKLSASDKIKNFFNRK